MDFVQTKQVHLRLTVHIHWTCLGFSFFKQKQTPSDCFKDYNYITFLHIITLDCLINVDKTINFGKIYIKCDALLPVWVNGLGKERLWGAVLMWLSGETLERIFGSGGLVIIRVQWRRDLQRTHKNTDHELKANKRQMCHWQSLFRQSYLIGFGWVRLILWFVNLHWIMLIGYQTTIVLIIFTLCLNNYYCFY